MVPAAGAAVGFALDPDADRLAIVDEKGRYIGEELTLALAATRRLGQEKGPVILNLSTSRVTETLARAAGCVVFRTPVGEINVVQRMVDVNAVLGGEGNGGVIDPRVGYVRDSFVGMAMVLDLMAATGEPLSNLVAGLPRYAMVKEQYPLAAAIDRRRRLARSGRRDLGALGPDRRRLARRPSRSPRRTAARVGRPLGSRPGQQHRADRAGDRRGRRAAPGSASWPTQVGRFVGSGSEGLPMTPSDWPEFDSPPAVAFVDVDGTLLAQTTTFLFARILYRRGWIRRSFFLRGLYHGLQHRFGRLDYGRLIAIGLNYIARIPVVELERIAYENFAEYVRPRLFEGVVDHLNSLRRAGTSIVLVSSSPGLVIQPLAIYLGCSDTLTTPVLFERGRLVGIGSGPACYGEGKRYWAEEWADEPPDQHGRRRRLRRQLERSELARAGRPRGRRAPARAALAAGQGAGMGHRPAPPARAGTADFRQVLRPAPQARCLIQPLSRLSAR